MGCYMDSLPLPVLYGQPMPITGIAPEVMLNCVACCKLFPPNC